MSLERLKLTDIGFGADMQPLRGRFNDECVIVHAISINILVKL
jgi:hypothetical protein